MRVRAGTLANTEDVDNELAYLCQIQSSSGTARALVNDRSRGCLAAILDRDARAAVRALPVSAVQVRIKRDDVVAGRVEALARGLADGDVYIAMLALLFS